MFDPLTPAEAAAAANYADPVRQLLAIDEPDGIGEETWPDYVAEYGLTEAHGPELLRILLDQALAGADIDGPLVWARVHAWRALGQLRMVAAIGPLLDFLNLEDFSDEDGASSELPVVFGLIGPAAIPLIANFLTDPAIHTTPATVAMEGLKEIASRHPEQRATCIDILIHPLQNRADEDESVLGFAVNTLVHMKAVEAIDPIRDAFRRDAVDISIVGDVEDVEMLLGLRQRRATPKPLYHARYGTPFAKPEGMFQTEIDEEPVKSVKVGRNDPCPCGSGKKYKKCCLA